MKKIIITIFAAASFLTSCSDAYEVTQPGYVTDESQVYNTPADIERGAKAVYAFFPGEAEIKFTSFFTDELGIGMNNGGQGINDGTYTFRLLVGDEKADDIWGGYYSVINRVNRILFRIDDLYATATPADKLGYDTQRAHLHILRAYSHFKLFSYFTPDYTNPSGLSVIKFDFLQTNNYQRFEKRSTVSEIVAFIENDLSKAKSLGGYNGNGTGFASDNLSDAILVKLYSMLQTQAAYDKMETSFNNLVENGKSLADFNQYSSLFSGGAEGSETIFKLNRVSSDGTVTSGVANEWYASEPNYAGNPYMEIGRSLYNELDKLDPSRQGQVLHDFEMEGGQIKIDPQDGLPVIANTYPRKDPRYTVAVLNGSIVNPGYASLNFADFKATDILLIGKYTGITDRPLMNDVVSLRFTDMLLCLAEKRAFEGALSGTVALGDYSNVESIIFNIRSNRNEDAMVPLTMPTNFSSARECYARILEERRVEFAFEGHRYLDMKRLGVRAGSPGFVRHAQDCAPTGACSLEPSSTRLTMPIPRAEIMANPNMVQNPGY